MLGQLTIEAILSSVGPPISTAIGMSLPLAPNCSAAMRARWVALRMSMLVSVLDRYMNR